MRAAVLITVCLCWVNEQFAEDGPDLENWVRRWAESTELTQFHTDFISRTESGVVRKGTWDLQLRPFAQYVKEDVFEGGQRVRQRAASWDVASGVGKTFIRHENSLRGSGTIEPRPPNLLGYIMLPSCPSFFFFEDRSISDYMKLVKVTVRALAGDTNDLAVYLQRAEPHNALMVYRFDRRRRQPVTEQRIYMRRKGLPPGTSVPQTDLGRDLDLPEGFRDSVLFVMRKVVRSAEVSGRVIPVEWRTVHGLGSPGHETTISLTVKSVVIDGPVPEHGYDFDWPAGSSVYDSFTGRPFNAGASGAEVKGDVTTEAGLDDILTNAAFQGIGARSVDRTAAVVTNCAANAIYLSSALVGRAMPLTEIVQSLGVKEESQLSTMEDVARVFRSHGEVCAGVRGDISLLRHFTQVPGLLHVRLPHRHHSHEDDGPPVDHYYVVDSYDEQAGTVRILDPPAMPFRARIADVEKVWTGNALVLGEAVVTAVSQASRAAWWKRALLLFAGGGAFLVAAALGLSRWRKGRNASLPGDAVVALIVFGIFSGCDQSRPPEDSHAQPPPVEVIGGAEVDLGRVKWTPDNIQHTFSLYNNTSQVVRITETRKDCGCLGVDLPSEELLPGATMEVRMGLDLLGLVGHKSAEAALVFHDPEIEPLLLKLSVFIERDYRVHLQPLLWQLPLERKSGIALRKTLIVHEFLSYAATETEETSVGVADESLRVVSLGPWRLNGRSVLGYARSAELTVEYAPPKVGPFLESVALMFRHQSRSKEVEAQEFKCDVPLRIRG